MHYNIYGIHKTFFSLKVLLLIRSSSKHVLCRLADLSIGVVDELVDYEDDGVQFLPQVRHIY